MRVKVGDITKIKTGKLDANAASEDGEYPFFTCSREPLRISSYSYDCECVLVAGNGDLNVKYYNGKFDAYQRTYIIEDNSDGKLYMPYLYLFMEGYVEELRRQAIGGVIKYIKLGNLTDAVIELPSVDEQKNIVEILFKTKQVLEHREEEIKKLDELIKARFVELFGNPLDKSMANKYFVECVDFNPKKSEVKDMMDETVSFVPMECVGVDGSFTIREDGLVRDYYKGYTYFRDGDVLLAKITPCFENGKVAIAENCTNGIGFGTTEFHVSRPIAGVSNSYWIKYMLKNDSVHDLATINMTGSAGQKRIQTPFFEMLKIYLPPIELQNQFADFVHQVDKSKVVALKAA